MKAKLTALKVMGRECVTGRMKCPVCEHKFRFVLPKETYLFWDGHCSTCSHIMPEEIPEKGHMTVEELRWD